MKMSVIPNQIHLFVLVGLRHTKDKVIFPFGLKSKTVIRRISIQLFDTISQEKKSFCLDEACYAGKFYLYTDDVPNSFRNQDFLLVTDGNTLNDSNKPL